MHAFRQAQRVQACRTRFWPTLFYMLALGLAEKQGWIFSPFPPEEVGHSASSRSGRHAGPPHLARQQHPARAAPGWQDVDDVRTLSLSLASGLAEALSCPALRQWESARRLSSPTWAHVSCQHDVMLAGRMWTMWRRCPACWLRAWQRRPPRSASTRALLSSGPCSHPPMLCTAGCVPLKSDAVQQWSVTAGRVWESGSLGSSSQAAFLCCCAHWRHVPRHLSKCCRHKHSGSPRSLSGTHNKSRDGSCMHTGCGWTGSKAHSSCRDG